MPKRRAITREELLAQRAKGFSYSEIGKMYGITRQGVSWKINHSGGKPPEKEETRSDRARKALPWKIVGPQLKADPIRQLRLHLEYADTQGQGMPEGELRRLRSLYDRLTNFSVVVRYDPSIPPMPGRKYGGFEYAPREDRDGDLILRIDEHTQIPEEDRAKWSLPPRESWPE